MFRNSKAYTGFNEILIQLRNHLSILLGSFCIVSLQLPEHPVQVGSKDIFLKGDLAKGEAYYIADKTTEQPWVVRQEIVDNRLADLSNSAGRHLQTKCWI